MKTGFYYFLILFAVACTNPKQQAPTVQPVTNIAELQPDALQFDTEMHDFGHLQAGEKLSFGFVFKNTGDGPILIKNVETDCGCIVAKIQQKQVNQGESGVVEVTFDSAGLFGRQLKTVEILWNSKELKHLVIFAEVENNQLEIRE